MKFGTFGTFTVVMMRHMKKENSEDGVRLLTIEVDFFIFNVITE